MTHIYLDANATTRLADPVRQVMLECYEQQYVNPASQHRPGQLARRQIEIARRSIGERLGADPGDRVIFTSGGTESNNFAIQGLLVAKAADREAKGTEAAEGVTAVQYNGQPSLLVSGIEHPSVLGAADHLASRALSRKIPVDSDGVVCIDQLTVLLQTPTDLVSLMLVNNETGVIQDLPAVSKACRNHGAWLHCDAVQGVGKIPVNFRDLDVAAMTVTAHKIHGPRGIGCLILKSGVEIQPLFFGGAQQLAQRPGTEDVALVTGFAKAVELVVTELPQRQAKLSELRDLFESTIRQAIPDVVIHGSGKTRAPHTSNLSFPGSQDLPTVNRQALLMACDAAGVAISTGSACSSGSSEPSHVLTAMGCPSELIASSIRISFSTLNQRTEVIQGAERIINAVRHLRRQKSHQK